MATLKNQDIRLHAKDAGVRLWEVSKAAGCSDNTLCRMLRDELPQERKAELIALIDRIAAEEGRA